MRANRSLLTALVIALVAIATSCLAVGPTTDIADLRSAADVNNAGVIAGVSGDATQAVRYDTTTGIATPIGSLSTVTPSPAAINDAGTVVGVARGADGIYHGFRAVPGSPMEQLGTLAPTATTPTSTAADINSSGVVVGTSRIPSPGGTTFHAVWFDAAGAPHDLGTLGGTNSEATAINDAGLIVGWSEVTVGSTVQHPFVYDPASGVMDDIGTMGGTFATATDVNEHGTVVGWAETPDCTYGCERKAFVYEHTTGSFEPLAEGSHPEWFQVASGINEDGVIVGTQTDPISCGFCPPINAAVAWEQGTNGLYALTQPPGYTVANAVNDSGLVVGTRLVPAGIFEPATFAGFWVSVTPVDP